MSRYEKELCSQWVYSQSLPGERRKESGGDVARVFRSTVQWVFVPRKTPPSRGFEEMAIKRSKDRPGEQPVGSNRAKVVASTTPRPLKKSRPGALQRNARQLNDNFMLNDNFNLYVNLRIITHNQML